MPGRVWKDIYDIALDQHGYVRRADLRAAGIDPNRLNEYAARGTAERVAQGVFRLLEVPHDRWTEFMLAALWPDGRGVLSHETALDLHELCDVNPDRIDVTVPATYRTHRDVPQLYRLHPARLDENEQTKIEGVPIVTPARAIADGIRAGLRDGLVEQAIETAGRQALITREQQRVLMGALNGRPLYRNQA